jgi:hypothetical protein
MTGHIINLVKLGDILKRNGKSDFDLTNGVLLKTREIKNATRACTLLNFLIRFLDQERLENKRWFFRSVHAYYSGHRGLFRLQKK